MGKVLESLVATLHEEWPDSRVLDLFAGTGTLGLAALEQGAASVVLVEGNPQVAEQLRRRLRAGASLVRGQLPGALQRLTGSFDIVLADPPYGDPAGPRTLAAVGRLVRPQGWVVFEHHHKTEYPQRVENLVLARRRRFGETALSYYRSQVPEVEYAETADPSAGGVVSDSL